MLALTSPTGCGRSVGIVHLRTKTTEFSFRPPGCDKSEMYYIVTEKKISLFLLVVFYLSLLYLFIQFLVWLSSFFFLFTFFNIPLKQSLHVLSMLWFN
jgi:hypothetical protein